jgi:hypothetical protein
MTVLTGVKAPFELTQYAIAIKQQGIDFVIRHYSHQSGKSLSLAEARALTDAGLQIGVLWEGPDVQLGYYSGPRAAPMARPLSDGAIGDRPAVRLGDLLCRAGCGRTGRRGGALFRGRQPGLPRGCAGERQYQVGVYGSAALCEGMLARGLAA